MKKPFIHLRCLSSYSLSESTLKIQKLVQVAKKNNMPALAITDNNNMFGVFEFAQECIKNNIQPIIGTSINLVDVQSKNKVSQLSFLVKNERGYKNLIHLSSLSYLIISLVATYVKNMTVNTRITTDWFTFFIAIFFSNVTFFILLSNQ